MRRATACAGAAQRRSKVAPQGRRRRSAHGSEKARAEDGRTVRERHDARLRGNQQRREEQQRREQTGARHHGGGKMAGRTNAATRHGKRYPAE
jgi:hypothetical protein